MRTNALAAIVLTLATQNVRLGMSPAHAGHDIDRAASRASVVLAQEMGTRRAARFAPAGYGTAHRPGRWRGDCAVYWDRAEWRWQAGRLVPLTHAPFHGGHRYALAVVLRQAHGPARVAVVCVHLITDWGRHVPTERAAIARLAVLRANLSARWPHVVIGGDWNRRYARRASLPGMRAGFPPRPTHPPKRIDYLYHQHMRATRTAVIGGTYSDHNGVRGEFTWHM